MFEKEFFLNGVTKESFAEVLEYCRKRNALFDTGELGLFHPVEYHAPTGRLTIGVSCKNAFGEQVTYDKLFWFELLQVTRDKLKVIVSREASIMGPEALVDAQLQRVLEALREVYGEAYSEALVPSSEQARLQAVSGAVGEQLTPAEDNGSKKHEPIDTKLDTLLAGQTAIREDLSGLRQALLARFDANEQTIITAVTQRLDQGHLAAVQTVLDAIEAGLVPIGELEKALVAVQHTLSEIQQQRIALVDSTLTSEQVKHLLEVADAPKLDVKHKLKLTVPIIPYFVSYEGELELKSALNLEAAWKRLVARVQGT